jgi:hypothetical protein
VTASEGCGGHPGISEELRALVLTGLDRIDPVLDRMRDEAERRAAGEGAGTRSETGSERCTACPVCAVLAALRGERPELAGRLAEHAAGLLAVLRAALADAAPAAEPESAPDPSLASDSPPARRVQHIRVDRPAQ